VVPRKHSAFNAFPRCVIKAAEIATVPRREQGGAGRGKRRAAAERTLKSPVGSHGCGPWCGGPAAVPIGGHKAKAKQQTRNAPGAAAKAARIAAAAVGIITPSLAIAQFTGRALAHPRCIANAEVPAKKEVGYLSAMPADSTTAVRSREDSACPAFDDSC
jgi:hypothetical protein